MPYKVTKKTVLVKKMGRWVIAARYDSRAEALRQAAILSKKARYGKAAGK